MDRMPQDDAGIRREVRRRYGEIATDSSLRPADGAKSYGQELGYSEAELESAPEGANLGLGCGNPTALAEISPGDAVVDLGSGAGFDAFLAAERVGSEGRVIGVDMTDEMLEQARANAQASGRTNVEFRKGLIEELPVDCDSVDVVLSNCVINLSPDKPRVFAEALRVLRPGGRLFVSDLMLEQELPEVLRGHVEAYIGCVGGTMLREDYLATVRAAGFADVEVLGVEAFGPMLLEQFPDLAAQIADEAGLSAAELDAAASSVVSVKVAATKAVGEGS